jgi:hypothetical protein
LKKVGHSFGKLNFFLYVCYVMRVQLLNPLNMNIVRFDRHELFTNDWMEYHSTTLRNVEDFHMDRDESWFTPLYNMLCGVWDGYLYTEMLEMAKEMELPTPILQRIANTIQFIGTSVK